jgi:N6-adenosine-specific RNA methylase IME4
MTRLESSVPEMLRRARAEHKARAKTAEQALAELWTIVESGKRFGVIYMDLPWNFKVRSEKGKGRSAERHYPVMTPKQMMELPIRQLAAEDCALFMWVIDTHLPQASKLIEARGFEFKTRAFVWVKTNRKSPGYFMGMGFWTRANPEDVWLATRGDPKRLDKGVRRLVVAPVREHSRKPDEVPDRIERLVAGPYLDICARTRRPGWTCWGDEV